MPDSQESSLQLNDETIAAIQAALDAVTPFGDVIIRVHEGVIKGIDTRSRRRIPIPQGRSRLGGTEDDRRRQAEHGDDRH